MANVYAEDTNTGEVFRAHWLKCVADIQSHFRISRDEAEEMLRKSTIELPICVTDARFWVEE